MLLSSLMLARMQFAANITFHILFPTITIGLCWLILILRCAYNKTRDESWMKAYFFFTKVFALSFAFGVVSGVTMSFQFGTNWPGFMNMVGNFAGPVLGYEVVSAFFLEATFLGVMLFGRRYISDYAHTFATFLVAVGTTLSAFWILSLNSWMHTPAGFELVDGIVIVKDWFAAIFNPSFVYRFGHMFMASLVTASFLMAGLSALRHIMGERSDSVKKTLKLGVFLSLIFIIVQFVVGDLQGLNTLEHNPQTIAAMEGLWHDEKGAPSVLFGIPNIEQKRNDYAIELPHFSSVLLTHSWNGEVKGLESFSEYPPVIPTFLSFRIMVGGGVLMLLIAAISSIAVIRNTIFESSFRYVLAASSLLGWVSTEAGWYLTEIGRQPYLVHALLKTEDAVGPVPNGILMTTLTLYLLLYVFLLIFFIGSLIYLSKKEALNIVK